MQPAACSLQPATGDQRLTSDNVTSVLPHVTAGRLRALGVTGPRRIPLASDIPTVAEAGVPGDEMTAWSGYMAPAGTPGPIGARLNMEINRVITSPAIRERWLALGIEPVSGTPERFAEHVRTEIVKWAAVIKRAGIKVTIDYARTHTRYRVRLKRPNQRGLATMLLPV